MVTSTICRRFCALKTMPALALLPRMRAIRSIPSAAWVRSPREILTFLAVNSTSMVSLRYLFSQQDVTAGELRILYRTGFSCQFSVVIINGPWRAKKAMHRDIGIFAQNWAIPFFVGSFMRRLKGKKQDQRLPAALRVALAALMSAGDVHVFAIFGYGAACQLDALIIQHRSQLFVGERMLRVLLGDELAYFALEHQQRRINSLGPVRTLGKEGAQLEDSLWGVSVLVGHGAADRRGVNADLLGHFLDHHGTERLNALLEKILLAVHNDLAGTQDCALALGDVAHELHRGAEALLNVLLHLFVGVFRGEHLPIAPAEPQAGHIILVHGDHPVVIALDEHYVRLYKPRLLAVVLAPGTGIKSADIVDGGVRLGGGDLGRTRQIFYVTLLQQVQMPVYDERGQLHAAPPFLDARLGLGAKAAMDIFFRAVRASPSLRKQMGKLMLLGGNLNLQALAQVAGAHAGRVKVLHQVDAAAQQLHCCCFFRFVRGFSEGRSQFFFAA